MSSEDGGVGTASSSVRRTRSSRGRLLVAGAAAGFAARGRADRAAPARRAFAAERFAAGRLAARVFTDFFAVAVRLRVVFAAGRRRLPDRFAITNVLSEP
jgi:hypothetical protein